MTKELLEQYPHICAEIHYLSRKLHMPVTDTVSGSSENYPYTRHPISIQGIPPGLAEQLEEQKRLKEDIETFVSRLPNGRLRTLVRLHVFDEMDWPQVSAAMDRAYKHQSKGNSIEALKQTYSRLLK